jgi:hypothetical protein
MLPDRATAKASTFLTALLALLCIGASPSRAEPQCVASFREIKFPDGSARVKNYVCKTEGSSKPVIRVEFDRLSEAAAGSLIQGEPYPDMERAFGKVRLVNNAVAAETKKIFDHFGIKKVDGDCFGFVVAAAAGGKHHVSKSKGMSDEGFDTCSETRTLWYLTFPDQMGLTTIEMPLPTEVEHYQTHDDWPQGYNFSYSLDNDCWETSPILCTLLWRPARPDDLANFVPNLIAYHRILGMSEDTPDGIAEWEKLPESWHYTRKKYFTLIDYLVRGGWPDDFLFVTSEADLCGGLQPSMHIRQMILDVAFVQNLSDNVLSLDGLLGDELTGMHLRKIESVSPAKTHRIALDLANIQPGETLAVPLRISFVMADSLQTAVGDQAVAKQAFARIRAAKPGTVFEMATNPGEPPIRKVRESFGPPTAPKPAAYAFGPEIQLSGLVLDGKPIVFEQASRNFMELVAGSGYGSCPYLYAWDDDQKDWVRHGKVIDAANSRDKEMTETKTFEGFRSKFRLAEEELEVSYIDHVKLEIELKDGGGMTLAPDLAAMNAKDGSYATIKAGDRIEFSFALPPSVKPADVKQSTLAITGYYRRYSDLLMARQ